MGVRRLRAISLTVLDEVRGGLVYFTTTLAAEIPRLYRELEEAITEFIRTPRLGSRRCSASDPGSGVIVTAIRTSRRQPQSKRSISCESIACGSLKAGWS